MAIKMRYINDKSQGLSAAVKAASMRSNNTLAVRCVVRRRSFML